MEKNLGHATAYGYAKSKGYSGTEEEFAQLMADYASVGQSAAQSAEQAAASASSASGSAATASQSAQTATSKASEALTAAGTATTKASEASTSADTASAAATSAITSAQTATTAAATATTKASEAEASEAAALSAKTDAESARDAAAQSASAAAESARTLTIDPTLTQPGQAADAKVVGDEIGELKSALINKININNFKTVNYEFSENGYINYSDGLISPAENAKATNLVPVLEGDKFFITCTIRPEGASVACYDKNGAYMQSASISGNFSGEFTVPNGVYYVKASFYGLTSKRDFYSIPKYNIDQIISNEYSLNESKADKTALIETEFPFSSNGYVTFNSGGISPSEYALNTGYIPTSKNDEFHIETITSDVGASIACYDINKRYIKESSVSGTYSGDFTIPEGIAYIIVSVYGLSNPKVCRSVPLVPTFDDLETIENQIENTNSKLNELKAELTVIHPELTGNGYIGSANGEVKASSYGRCTDFIDVVEFDRVYWNCKNGNSSVARVAFYDGTKTYISELTISKGSEGTVYLSENAYANVRYVRLSYYSLPDQDFGNFKGEIYKSNSILNVTEQYRKISGYGDPVDVLIFGDSITDCAGFTIVDDKTTVYNFTGINNFINEQGIRISYKMWPLLFKEFVDCRELRNYAQSGASYKDQSDPDAPRKSLFYQITLALNDLPNPNGAFEVNDFNPDVIIMALGTNDGVPNDTPELAEAKIIWDTDKIDIDATLANFDRSKFCEAAMWAYFKLRTVFPDALIICELPIQRMSGDAAIGTMHDYLMTIAQKYGGAVIADGAKESGIVRENNVKSGLGATLKDGLHPNDKGQNMLARLIIGKYYSSYIPFTYMNQ